MLGNRFAAITWDERGRPPLREQNRNFKPFDGRPVVTGLTKWNHERTILDLNTAHMRPAAEVMFGNFCN